MRWDILLPIFLYLLITFFIGGYLHKYLKQSKKSFQEEYFVGGRSLGPIVLAFTVMASAASAGTFIGAPGLAYDVGFSWILVVMTQVTMGVYILGMLGKKFAIVARKIKAVTLTDFLKERFESNSIVIGSSLGIIIFIIAYMVAQFAGGAIILEAVTGLPYEVGLIIFGIAVVFYTAYGGFRAVALTDAIQGLIMVGGGVLLWIYFMVKTDGFSVLVRELAHNYPDLVTLPGGNGTTPALLFSYFLLFGIAAIGMPHASVRAMTYKDSKSMHQAIMISGVVMGLFTVGFGVFGPVIKILYPDIEMADMAMPTLVLDLMPGWIAGIVLAAPLAAIMSTVDSMLLVTSSTIVKDLYLNYVNPYASERRIKKLSYITTLIIGVGTILFALTPPEYLQLIVVFAMGGLEATFFAPLLFGLYWKRANRWGAVTSMYTGLISYIVISRWWPNLFGMNAIATSLALSIGTMICISLLTPRPSVEVIQKFWGKTISSNNIQQLQTQQTRSGQYNV